MDGVIGAIRGMAEDEFGTDALEGVVDGAIVEAEGVGGGVPGAVHGVEGDAGALGAVGGEDVEGVGLLGRWDRIGAGGGIGNQSPFPEERVGRGRSRADAGVGLLDGGALEVEGVAGDLDGEADGSAVGGGCGKSEGVVGAFDVDGDGGADVAGEGAVGTEVPPGAKAAC